MKELPVLRTLLYIPGNNPGMINSSHIYDVDCIVLDLEDSVPLSEKDSARILIKNSLINREIIFPEVENIMVRINHLDTGFGEEDLSMMIGAGCLLFRVPKIESPEDVDRLDKIIGRIEKENGIENGSVKLMVILETVRGISNAEEIASSSSRIIGLTMGAEDLTRDMGTSRSRDGVELEYSRGKMVIAAKNSGILAIDTVFSDVRDEEGLEKEVKKVKQMGFDGKSIIHPSQADIIHKIFTPTEDEIDLALRIEVAMKEAEEKGSAAIAVDGKMVDTPVLKKAKRTLEYARKLKLI